MGESKSHLRHCWIFEWTRSPTTLKERNNWSESWLNITSLKIPLVLPCHLHLGQTVKHIYKYIVHKPICHSRPNCSHRSWNICSFSRKHRCIFNGTQILNDSMKIIRQNNQLMNIQPSGEQSAANRKKKAIKLKQIFWEPIKLKPFRGLSEPTNADKPNTSSSSKHKNAVGKMLEYPE